VLGAVEAQRATAEDPRQHPNRQQHADDELDPGRQDEEGEWGDQKRDQEPPLVRGNDAVATHDRRDRRAESSQTADERNPAERFRRLRHLALSQRAVDTRERPEPLADDHDAVRPRHPSEPGQPRKRVCARKEIEGGGLVHPLSIVKGRPPGNPPGGLFNRCAGPRSLPAAAAEEAKQRQHENHDQDDPEN
jgi:hypothetical protein